MPPKPNRGKPLLGLPRSSSPSTTASGPSRDREGAGPPTSEDPLPHGRGSARWLGVAFAFLLALALVARQPGLDGAVTEDEDQWMARAGNFAAGIRSADFGRTYQTGHPGVVPMWLITLALGTERAAELSPRGQSDFVVTALPQFLPDLRQARLPFVAFGAGLCVAVAGLTARLVGPAPGLIAGALLVTDPYWAAMSPVVGMDGLLAGFLGVSLLTVLVAFRSTRHRPAWIALSGVAWALAALTKTSAVFMLPALAVLLLLGLIPTSRRGGVSPPDRESHPEIGDASRAGKPRPYGVRTRIASVLEAGKVIYFRSPQTVGPNRFRMLVSGSVWLVAAGAILFILWPAMWAQPVATLVRALEFSARLGGTPHAPGNYLLGSTADDPGPLFYPVALMFRLGPATSLGLLALLTFGAPRGARRLTWALLLAAGSFFLLLEISPKKVDRYLMPVVPLLTIVSAIGWWAAVRWAAQRTRVRRFALTLGVAIVAGALQAWPLLGAGRYPLAAYNPLSGGARVAELAIPVGWGEGLDDAGAIIAGLSGGAPVTTSIWFPLRVNFQAHAPGPVVTERQLNQADFFVDYIHARQRRHTPAQLQRRPPDAVVTINGVDYVRIYRLR